MLKKIKFILILLLVNNSIAFAQETGIVFFKGSFEEALLKAKSEHKLLFIDCMASWCGPCKRLAAEEFVKPAVGEFFNNHFVNITMDMESNPAGPALRQKYDVDYYPTLLLINPQGYKITDVIAGEFNAERLIQWGKAYMNLVDTVTLEQRFSQGDRAQTLMTSYFKELLSKHNEKRAEMVLTQTTKEKGYAILYKQPYFNVIEVLDIKSPIAKYFMNHWETFAKETSPDEVAAKISGMYNSVNYYSHIYGPGPQHAFDKKAYTAMITDMRAYKLPYFDFIQNEIDAFIAFRSGEQDKVFQILTGMLVEAKPWQYHDVAKLANKYLTKDYRSKAAQWAKIAAEKNAQDPFIQKQCLTYYHELLTAPHALIANQSYPFQIDINL